jgi:hypothetical protein
MQSILEPSLPTSGALSGPVVVHQVVHAVQRRGRRPLLYCATAPELASQTGRYYDRSREIPPSPLASDDNLARELWIRTEPSSDPESLTTPLHFYKSLHILL